MASQTRDRQTAADRGTVVDRISIVQCALLPAEDFKSLRMNKCHNLTTPVNPSNGRSTPPNQYGVHCSMKTTFSVHISSEQKHAYYLNHSSMTDHGTRKSLKTTAFDRNECTRVQNSILARRTAAGVCVPHTGNQLQTDIAIKCG
jgi:hypothetical protein